MTEVENKNRAIREEAAFIEGAEQVRKAILEVYSMHSMDIKAIFNMNIWDYLEKHTAQELLDKLNHKDELLAAYVEVGDIIAKNENPNFTDVVTYVYPDRTDTFDAIGYCSERMGKVIKCTTLKEMKSHKTGACISTVPIVPTCKFNWE